MDLVTLPNNTSGQRLFERHTIELPIGCCPRSRNPRSGSTISIAYRARSQVLEVASLYAYLHRFVGGLRSGQGELLVRDLEGMIQQIAQDTALALGVPTRVRADVVVLPHQVVQVIARGYPEGAE